VDPGSVQYGHGYLGQGDFVWNNVMVPWGYLWGCRTNVKTDNL